MIPVWVGILALSGMFLMGQDTWAPPPCTDLDGDGYGDPASRSCAYAELDCDDSNADVHPGPVEVCDNGIDDDCDELVDGDDECNLAPIPQGCFDMGDHFEEGQSYELPVHNVCISAFEMDVHEVTNAEYAECVDDWRCIAPYFKDSLSRPSYHRDPAYDDYPVIWVSWSHARDYCTWAGKRLPTEAEWEYAARGGLSGKRYPWGDTITCDDACYGRFLSSAYCWNYCHNGVCDNDTHPVGNYAPNGYGLYDMAGNVWEWVNDLYQPDYYTVSPPNDPQGPASGFLHVLRGGSYGDGSYHQRVARRDTEGLGPLHPFDDIGFRCAR